jgi:hypothetical protein
MFVILLWFQIYSCAYEYGSRMGTTQAEARELKTGSLDASSISKPASPSSNKLFVA